MNNDTKVSPYPWQQQQWNYLQQQLSNERLPHALLLGGATGLGQFELAVQFSQYLLCSKEACGNCHDCRLWAAKTHPDLHMLSAETGAIKVDAIRQLQAWSATTRHGNGYKVVIIDDAHAMNRSAANALLKNLEEPTDKTLFILISEQAMLLPATIRSRCQIIKFYTTGHESAKLALLKPVAEPEEAKLLLRLTDYAPLQAIKLAESEQLAQRKQVLDGLLQTVTTQQDPLTWAQALNDIELTDIISWLTHCVVDVIRCCSSLSSEGWVNQDYIAYIKQLAQQTSWMVLYKLLDRLYQLRRQLLMGSHLNRQLMLESLACQWLSLQRTNRT